MTTFDYNFKYLPTNEEDCYIIVAACYIGANAYVDSVVKICADDILIFKTKQEASTFAAKLLVESVYHYYIESFPAYSLDNVCLCTVRDREEI